MKITDVETFRVPPRWLFLRVATDEGIVGWGEPTVEGRVDTVQACIAEVADLLVGTDPMRIEDHWQVLSKGGFYRGGVILSSVVSGIDQALWDIAGKALGVPAHVMMGGPVRDRVRLYTWVGGDEPDKVTDQVQEAVEAGFTAVKMNATGRMPRTGAVRLLNEATGRVAAARDVLGPDRDIAVDAHGRLSLQASRQLVRLLEPLAPLFVEEPVLPEYTHLLHQVVETSTVPIATGERLFSRRDFLPALQAGIAVAQPDLAHAGGISESRRIAALAEMFDVPVAPHCPLGPIALAASLQIGFATPNYLIQEQSHGIHYNVGGELLDLVVDPAPLAFIDGCIERPIGPGLGLEIDEAAVRSADRTAPDWTSPWWRYDDGSFAEW